MTSKRIKMPVSRLIVATAALILLSGKYCINYAKCNIFCNLYVPIFTTCCELGNDRYESEDVFAIALIQSNLPPLVTM